MTNPARNRTFLLLINYKHGPSKNLQDWAQSFSTTPLPLQPNNFTALNANNIYKRRVDAFAVTNLNCKHFAGSLASRAAKCFEYSDKSDVYKNRQ